MAREIEVLRVDRRGSIRPGASGVAWLVYDDTGNAIGPIAEFLRDFAARGNSQGSVRSYAYALLRWWRWLEAVGVDWDRATPAEVRDLTLWLQLHPSGEVRHGQGLLQAQQDSFETSVVKALATMRMPSVMVR